MAAIDGYLEKIITAIYGRDVRQAIHDAILQCYTDGKAGAEDVIARTKAQEALTKANNASSYVDKQIKSLSGTVSNTYATKTDVTNLSNRVNTITNGYPKRGDINGMFMMKEFSLKWNMAKKVYSKDLTFNIEQKGWKTLGIVGYDTGWKGVTAAHVSMRKNQGAMGLRREETKKKTGTYTAKIQVLYVKTS